MAKYLRQIVLCVCGMWRRKCDGFESEGRCVCEWNVFSTMVFRLNLVVMVCVFLFVPRERESLSS